MKAFLSCSLAIMVIGAAANGSFAEIDSNAPPESAQHYNEGIQSFEQKDFLKAAQSFAKAIAIYPKFTEASLNMSQAYISLNKPQEAIKALKHAIQYDPNNPKPYVRIGTIYMNLGKPQDAIAYLEKSTYLENKNAAAQAQLGMAYVSLGMTTKGQRFLKQAVNIRPSNLDEFGIEAKTYAVLGNISEDPNKSMMYLKKAIQLDPEMPETYLYLGQTALKVNQTEDALESFRKAKRLFQKNKDSEGARLAEKAIKSVSSTN